MRFDDVPRLSSLLDRVGKKLRVDDASSAGQIWRRWSEIVGDDIARNAEPTSLKDGVLRIRTTTPTWATEMSYLAADLVERVNRAVGKPAVREVKVWSSPDPIAPRRGNRKSAGPAPETTRARDRSDDPKEAFAKAFEAWSKRRSGGPR